LTTGELVHGYQATATAILDFTICEGGLGKIAKYHDAKWAFTLFLVFFCFGL